MLIFTQISTQMNNLEFKIDEIKKLLEQGQIEVAMSGIKTLLMQLELKTLKDEIVEIEGLYNIVYSDRLKSNISYDKFAESANKTIKSILIILNKILKTKSTLPLGPTETLPDVFKQKDVDTVSSTKKFVKKIKYSFLGFLILFSGYEMIEEYQEWKVKREEKRDEGTINLYGEINLNLFKAYKFEFKDGVSV